MYIKLTSDLAMALAVLGIPCTNPTSPKYSDTPKVFTSSGAYPSFADLVI